VSSKINFRKRILTFDSSVESLVSCGGIGTERLDIRMRTDLREGLNKIPEGGRTAFLEHALEPLLTTLDPGKPCATVCKISDTIKEAKRQALDAVGDGCRDDALRYLHVARVVVGVVAPYASLCECSKHKVVKNIVKKKKTLRQI
jgi:hypothetical protein